MVQEQGELLLPVPVQVLLVAEVQVLSVQGRALPRVLEQLVQLLALEQLQEVLLQVEG